MARKTRRRAKKVARPKTHEEDPFLPLSEVGRQLGKHPETIRRWIMDGIMPFSRLPGGRFQVRQSTVDQYLTLMQHEIT